MYGILVYFFICGNPVLPQGYKDALRATALLSLSTHLHVGLVVGRSVGWLVAQSGKLIGGGGSGEEGRETLERSLNPPLHVCEDLSHLAFPRKWKEHKCNK